MDKQVALDFLERNKHKIVSVGMIYDTTATPNGAGYLIAEPNGIVEVSFQIDTNLGNLEGAVIVPSTN